MSKTNTFENELLRHVFLNEAIALLGDASGVLGSAAPGSLYVSLHSSDPGEGADQTTNEIAYTGYSRVAVPRSGAGWSVTGSTATNVGTVAFGACTSGSATATHFGIGCSSAGAGKMLYKGALSAPLAITSSPSILPFFDPGDITATEE